MRIIFALLLLRRDIQPRHFIAATLPDADYAMLLRFSLICCHVAISPALISPLIIIIADTLYAATRHTFIVTFPLFHDYRRPSPPPLLTVTSAVTFAI